MPDFVTGPVGVTVPATAANLGPGFDSLGLALELRDTVRAEVTDRDVTVSVSGAGAEEVPRGEDHLVVRAMRAAFDLLGGQPPGLRLECHNVVPHSRGLGSSSAAIVAGAGLARALVRDGADLLDDDGLFRLAARIEGHPDNVAPAVHGGLRVCGSGPGGDYAAAVPLDPGVRAVALVPPDPVRTDVARGLLPETVPHADAAANAGRAALLVTALGGSPEWLWQATHDVLHQDFREPAMPQSLALVRSLRALGVPAVVSGAGPTVLVLLGGADPGPADWGEHVPSDWAVHELEPAVRGLRPE